MPCARVPALLLLVFGELGMLWVLGNPTWSRKPITKRLGMVLRVEMEDVWDGDWHQKHNSGVLCDFKVEEAASGKENPSKMDLGLFKWSQWIQQDDKLVEWCLLKSGDMGR